MNCVSKNLQCKLKFSNKNIKKGTDLSSAQKVLFIVYNVLDGRFLFTFKMFLLRVENTFHYK